MPAKQVIGPELGRELESYKGQWVAIVTEEQRVVASADSLHEVLCLAKENGFADPLPFYVPALKPGEILLL